MVTEKQIQANRQNSLKGGVKTQTGKDIVRNNSIKHGVLNGVLISTEADQAQEIHTKLNEEYKPETPTENMLIETIAISYVRLQRALKAESDFLAQTLNPTVYEEVVVVPPLLANRPVNPLEGKTEIVVIEDGYNAKITSGEIDVIDRTFARYISTCERQFYKALHELQRVQMIRKGKMGLFG